MNQFLRFCVVGVMGFVVDAGILQLLVSAGAVNPYLGRVASFLAAASVTWFLNRYYTFKVIKQPTHQEWVRYMTAMALGALVNYGAFAIATASSALIHAQPWLGVAIGSVAGLGVNFVTSRRLVFKTE